MSCVRNRCENNGLAFVSRLDWSSGMWTRKRTILLLILTASGIGGLSAWRLFAAEAPEQSSGRPTARLRVMALQPTVLNGTEGNSLDIDGSSYRRYQMTQIALL